MQPTLSEQKRSERDAIARATTEFLKSGGRIAVHDNVGKPVRHLSWRQQSIIQKKAGVTHTDLNPPKPKRHPVKPSFRHPPERAAAAHKAHAKARRDKHAAAVQKWAEDGLSANAIGVLVGIDKNTVIRIADEHHIPLKTRRGTRQARSNAELRKRWE